MQNPLAVCVDRNPFNSADELVEMIGMAGFARIEWFETGEAEVWSSPPMAAKLRALVRRHGLAPQYHAPYEAPFDLAREGRLPRTPQGIAAMLSVCMDRAERLEADLMTVHLGSCPEGVDRGAALRNVLEGVLLAAPELEKRRIRLALENHTDAIIERSLGDRPQDFDWLMENMSSERVGRTLDIGHAHINGHLEEFLSHPFATIFNIHLHDNQGSEDQHLPLGEGTVPWQMVLRRIVREAYRGPLTFEFFAPPPAYLLAIGMVRAAT